MRNRVLALDRRQHILATSLGKKKSSPANMAEDKSKIDPRNIDNPQYYEILEDQRQALEIKLKEIEAEAKKKLISCYGKTRQGVIQKEKFILPTLSSSTSTDAHEVTAPVSTTSSNVTMEKVENLFAERDE